MFNVGVTFLKITMQTQTMLHGALFSIRIISEQIIYNNQRSTLHLVRLRFIRSLVTKICQL